MGTIIVSVILIAAVILALIFSRKRAGGDCGCGCSDGCVNKKNCKKNRE